MKLFPIVVLSWISLMIKDIEHFLLCLLIIHTHTRKRKKLRQIQRLNVKPRALNLLEENTEYFYDLAVMGGLWQDEACVRLL